jgi:hypothetical protein
MTVGAHNNSCPMCNKSKSLSRFSYIDLYWASSKIFDGLSVEYCNECGFGFSTPEIEDDVVNDFYTNIYRSPESPFFTAFSTMSSRPLSHNPRALAQLILANHFVAFDSGDMFVDVGPGCGDSFLSAEYVLRNPKMMAVELNDGAAMAYKRVYEVDTCESIDLLSEYAGEIKMILSSHSLEHFKLKEAMAFLEGIKKILSHQGVFVIEVPCVDMRIHSNIRRSGDSPHFMFFSKSSLRILLESSGFEVLFMNSCGPKYDDWFAARNEKTTIQSPSRVKKMAKSIFQCMPISIKRFIKSIYKKFTKDTINFDADDFSYGGNRTCLRVVARPCHTSND